MVPHLFVLRCIAFIAFARVADATQSWPITYAYAPDNMPIVQVRLAPPTKPMPEIAAIVSSFEKQRMAFEAEKMIAIEAAYNSSLEEAATKLSDAIDRLMLAFESSPSAVTFRKQQHQQDLEAVSFHEARSGTQMRKPGGQEMTAIINVLPIKSPDGKLRGDIETLERKRQLDEGAVFEQVESEMKGLTQIVEREIEAHVTRYVNEILHAIKFGVRARPNNDVLMSTGSTRFLVGTQPVLPSGPQLTTNVRVMASEEPFPTVESLVEDMEKRRDVSEDALKSNLIEWELKLLQAENELVIGKLGSWVDRILRKSV